MDLPARPLPALGRSGVTRPAVNPTPNDVTARDAMWRRFGGDDWACYDALPPAIRQRLQEHACDAWSVNALKLWRFFRRKRGHSAPAAHSMMRYLDNCERLERQAFPAAYSRCHGGPLPHDAAGVAVLRYGPQVAGEATPPSAP